ncbi:hypothetical protein [Patulibacter sp. SYSU D01012]|uniref:hypothetical protein n=1 Tax=Patulibacter sp. SYSU D01012 TaxID=2817381 RepID=UPI001B300C1D|nr:hypothetical protein [Patulibacter sp. SYSU D01012]
MRIDGHALSTLEQPTLRAVRRTTVVALRGGGHEGRGEDVTYEPEEHEALASWDGLPDLRGTWTIASLSDRLGAARLFPAPPAHAASARYRRWAFESAALDLALRQAGRTWAAVVGRDPRPMTFVSSRGLGDPPDPAAIADLRRRSPGVGLKLDLGAAWDADAIAAVRATGACSTVDLKGLYVGTVVDTPADPDTYRRVVEGLPDALIEDARITDATREILRRHADRLTWDATLLEVADLDALEWPPRVINLKPSRIGSLRELSALYDACRERGIGVYSGGQTELGVGRGQAQLLAATFHPDGPNDLAPTAFNAPDLPQDLPSSPLDVQAGAGFRLRADD